MRYLDSNKMDYEVTFSLVESKFISQYHRIQSSILLIEDAGQVVECTCHQFYHRAQRDGTGS